MNTWDASSSDCFASVDSMPFRRKTGSESGRTTPNCSSGVPMRASSSSRTTGRFRDPPSGLRPRGDLLYYEQELPDADPEGLARTVDEVFSQYGRAGIEGELVDLGEWYEWLHD